MAEHWRPPGSHDWHVLSCSLPPEWHEHSGMEPFICGRNRCLPCRLVDAWVAQCGLSWLDASAAPWFGLLLEARVAWLACAGGLALPMRVCALGRFPDLVSDCFCMPDHHISLYVIFGRDSQYEHRWPHGEALYRSPFSMLDQSSSFYWSQARFCTPVWGRTEAISVPHHESPGH